MDETIKIVRCDHNLADTGDYFTVDPITRNISHPNSNMLTLVQGDANSEVYTIRLPKFIDSHPMDQCTNVEIHYINTGAGGEKMEDVHNVSELKSYPNDEEHLYAEWILSANASMYNGTTSFAMKFKCTKSEMTVNENGEEDLIVKVLYSWSTLPFTGISVGRTIDNGESVIDQYSDIIAEWYNKLVAGKNGFDAVISESVANGRAQINELMSSAQSQAESIVQDTNQLLSDLHNRQVNSRYIHDLNLFCKVSDTGSGTYVYVKGIPIGCDFASNLGDIVYIRLVEHTVPTLLKVYMGRDNKSAEYVGNVKYEIFGDYVSKSGLVISLTINVKDCFDNSNAALTVESIFTFVNPQNYEEQTDTLTSYLGQLSRTSFEVWDNNFSYEGVETHGGNGYFIETVLSIPNLLDETLNTAKSYTDMMTKHLKSDGIILYDYEYGDPYIIRIMNGQLHIAPYTEPYKED